jgi:acyl-CoA synthetase (AMP-forming)/AMP-acid ligase II
VNVGTLLAHWAREKPDGLAVVCGAQRYTFREYARRIDRVANAFRALGLRQGDKLAVVLPNCIELLDTYRAAARLGIVLVPLSTLLRGAGLVSLLRDSDAAAVLASGGMVEALDAARPELPGIASDRYILVRGAGTPGYRDYAELLAGASEEAPPPVHLEDRDVFNIIYSSGTTGQPKGIVHDHYVRAMYCSLFANAFRITPESVVLHAGSLVFNGAFVTLMPSWGVGCAYVLLERFDPAEFIATVRREGVTHIMTVPSQAIALLNDPGFSADAMRSVEMFCTVGAPLLREQKERLLQIMPQSMYELYGLTEGFVTILDRSHYAAHIDSVGTPTAFSDMRIVSPEGADLGPGGIGEIVGRSPFLMPGYYQRPDLTAQAIVDGWLFTGDLGFQDEAGFLHLVDRKKDLIISGGVNVYPRDIEEIAATHPSVREVAVFGVPSEKWGEAPVAAIVLRQGEPVGEAELCEWINARVAARYQRLHGVILLEDFPRSTAGKTLKRVLRDEYGTRATPR